MAWSIVIVVSCLGVIISGCLMSREQTSAKAEHILSIFGIISLVSCVVSFIGLSLSTALA